MHRGPTAADQFAAYEVQEMEECAPWLNHPAPAEERDYLDEFEEWGHFENGDDHDFVDGDWAEDGPEQHHDEDTGPPRQPALLQSLGRPTHRLKLTEAVSSSASLRPNACLTGSADDPASRPVLPTVAEAALDEPGWGRGTRYASLASPTPEASATCKRKMEFAFGKRVLLTQTENLPTKGKGKAATTVETQRHQHRSSHQAMPSLLLEALLAHTDVA